MIGDPRLPLPAVPQVDLPAFWRSFDDNAPVHLRAGFRLATVAIAVVLPRLMGHARGLSRLPADDADAVVQRATSLPGLSDLAEVAKLVACFAYFSDPAVQSAARGRS